MSRRVLLALAAAAQVCAPLLAAEAEDQPAPELRWIVERDRPAAAHVEVSGLDAGALAALDQGDSARLGRVLSVYAEPAEGLGDLTLPPMAGRYTVGEKVLRFEPAFGLSPGMRYRALLRLAELPEVASRRVMSAVHALPAQDRQPSTVVSEVYPTAEELPENLLKFYVHFSAPMSRGRVYEHIRILTGEGRPVDAPFLEIDEELWDSRLQRLTLFFDPGRVKRGVKPLEEIGSALQEGRRYVLVIDEAFQDGFGTPLRAAFRREFRVGPPDRQPPHPDRWTVSPPPAGTRDSLTIDFGEPLDHALARRLIEVKTADGRAVRGAVGLARHEQRWTFTPELDWAAGSYQLVIGGTLEDLGGNSVGRPFEVDLFETVERTVPQQRVVLKFGIK